MTVGLDCILGRNTGAYSSPTWSSVLAVKDLTVPGEATKIDKSSRASIFKQYTMGQIALSLSFGLIRDDDKTSYTAFRTAFLGRTTVDLAIADGVIATTGTIYMRMQLGVAKFEEKQGLEGAIEADVELVPTDGVTHPPAMVTV